MNIDVILFSDFETLDVFGPIEVFGKLDDRSIRYFSEKGGLISNRDGVKIETERLEELTQPDILFIPGGMGTRKEIENDNFISKLKEIALNSRFVLTVCTGSALLAKTGLLDTKQATSNKRAFDWVASISNKVHWIRQARWVVDEKYYTSSGVSAGIDMTLGFIADQVSLEEARRIAFRIEYTWQEDKNHDDFCNQSSF